MAMEQSLQGAMVPLVEAFVALLIALAVGIALGAWIAVLVMDHLHGDPDDIVQEELEALRSARRLTAAATQTGQAMRREARAVESRSDRTGYRAGPSPERRRAR